MGDWIDDALRVAADVRDSDISGIKNWTNEQIVAYFDGKDGEDRDAFVWADVCREVKRRKLDVVPDDSKFNFW
jgi:hypothetical protein